MVIGLVTSFLMVALAEMGDKTQLVAFSLASRYRRPWLVMLGILIATTINHGLASSAGVWAARQVPETILGWLLGLGFIVFGAWTLVPDMPEPTARGPAWGPLVSTVIVFFLAEMGDKTQLATVALAARFGAPFVVTVGTTLGMLTADGLAVFAGSYLSTKVPMRLVRWIAATLFFVFGALAILGRLGIGG